MTDVLSLKEDLFPLPSRGMAYEFPLEEGTSVKLRPLVAGDMRHLAGSRGDGYKAYFSLLSRVITAPKELPFDELLLDDVNAILFGMRIRSFGPQYKINFLCTECLHSNSQEMSLLSVLIKTPEDVPNFQAKGLEFEMNGKKIKVDLPRLKDEKVINKLMSDLRSAGQLEDEDNDRAYIRVACLIKEIDGKPQTPRSAFAFLDNSPIGTPELLSDKINEFSIGLLPTQPIDCEACGHTNEVRMVITPEFFRPNS